jgi:aminomethyltransferase
MALRTPLYERHVALDARIVDFSGWDMPVQYPEGILAEHNATREKIGIFDTCHMGEFLFEGENVREALNMALAGSFKKLGLGRCRYTFITNENGGVIDDAVVMLFSETKAWMVVNAGDIPGDFEAVKKSLPSGITATNLSEKTGKLDVQGPEAWKLVKDITGQDFRVMPFYSFIEIKWRGRDMILSRSGYTGEPGAELYVAAEFVGELWDELLEKGKPFGAEPCGLGARDTLRLEAGMPLYGHELTTELNPIYAGFEKFVVLKKSENFPGKDALLAAQQKLEQNPESLEVLVGLKMEDKRTPRAGFVVRDGEAEIGRVTSGAIGPTVGATLALAYVKNKYAKTDAKLAVESRGKLIPCAVVELPFYSNPALREKTE